MPNRADRTNDGGWDEEKGDYASFQRRRIPVTEKLLELTKDMQWHDREEILREAMKVVEPGPAFRWAERQRINNSKLRAKKSMDPEEYRHWLADQEAAGWPRDPYRGNHDMGDIVRSGQRGVVVERIHSSRRFEVRTHDGRTEVRQVPFHPRFTSSKAAQERERAKAEGREPQDYRRLYDDPDKKRERQRRQAEKAKAKRAAETPEEREARLEAQRERMRQRRAQYTPEEVEERNRKARERHARRRNK